MNKLLKGSIAGAAGIALLLGGAGTFAFWNDSVAIDSAVVTAGTLKVTPTTAGAWSYSQGGADIAISDLANFAIVPGTVLKYTRTMTIGATGQGMVASLALTGGSIAANSAAAADVALAAELTKTAQLAVTGTGIVGTSPGTSFTVTPGNGAVSAAATVTVTLSFPNKATAQNGAQAGKVKLDALAVTLTQTTPAVPAPPAP